jgi:hypothetical protein
MVEKIIAHWNEIKDAAKKTKFPFAYRILPRGRIEKLS